MSKQMDDLIIENARLIFKNFAGNQDRYNPEGSRNFCVVIDDPELADQLHADGWNIKWTKPRDKDDEPMAYLPVKVQYGQFPPTVYLISGHKKTLLDEDSVNTLDYADIKNADLIINPYQWTMNGAVGVKAYLKTAYITIEEDRFAHKYDFSEDEVPFN